MRGIPWLCSVLVLLAAGVTPALATVWYLSPAGRDTWSGRLPDPNADGTDGPLASLEAARDAARKAPAGAVRRVVLREGSYYLPRTLVLQPQDSGLSVEAAAGQTVRIIGGVLIRDWQPDEGGWWRAKLPVVNGQPGDFRMLVVNGRLGKRARLPDKGFLTHLSDFTVPWMSTTGGGWQRKPTQQELTTLRYQPQDLGPTLDIRNAELTVYHSWDESMVGLASHDPAKHVLVFSTPAGHPPGAFNNHNYVVWNVREGMRRPGQWYLDRTAQKVVYWPLAGEDMARAQVLAPVTDCLIRLQGRANEPVRGVSLRGLTLSVTNTPLRAGGFGAGLFDGAVGATLAQDCHLEGLTILNVGGQAIKAEQCRQLIVRDCQIHHAGACGLIVRGEDCTAINNDIHDIGTAYPSAIALWVDGKKNKALHNEIRDVPYTAIAAGGEDHLIEANRISRAMKELDDGGGVYISLCKRVTVRGNLVTDIRGPKDNTNGYYLDEQAEDCLVESNVVTGVARPFLNHMARRNTLRNNVAAFDGDMRLTFAKCEGYRLERNVLIAGGGLLVQSPTAGITAMPSNILHSKAGQLELETFGVGPEGYRSQGRVPFPPRDGTVLADPRLLTPKPGMFRFPPASPARKLGIAPLDVSRAGRQPRPTSATSRANDGR